MAYWFMIPDHLIFVFCILFFVIIIQAIIISKLLKYVLRKNDKSADATIEWLRGWWLEFIIYVLATSVVGIFIASLVKKQNITLADVNGWVSIILGFVALVVGIISLYLSFYNVDQANKSQEQIQQTAEELSPIRGWQQDLNGNWHFYYKSGQMAKNEWKKSGDGWFYLGSDGTVQKDIIVNDDGNLYYVDKEGMMVTNTWVKADGKKYYMMASGKAFMNGTITIDNKEYTFENGCLKDDNKLSNEHSEM